MNLEQCAVGYKKLLSQTEHVKRKKDFCSSSTLVVGVSRIQTAPINDWTQKAILCG